MRILVPSSGSEAATDIAAYVTHIAKRLDATLIAMHILSAGESEMDGKQCCAVFTTAAEQAGVKVETQVTTGDVVEAIIDQCRLAVVTIPGDDAAKQVVRSLRELNPHAVILVRCRYEENASRLRKAGATSVISDETETLNALIKRLEKHVARSEQDNEGEQAERLRD